MNNICTKCQKLNPLDNERCCYCGSFCQKILTKEVGKFLISKATKVKEEEKMASQDVASNDEKVFICTGCGEEFSMQDIITRDIMQNCDICGEKIKAFLPAKSKNNEQSASTAPGS